ANGGQIYLTTNAKDELLKGVVNHSGIIEASSIDELTQSEVILFAHGGTTNVDGSIIAKNSFVETSGEKLNITSNTKVVAKDWLLDPTNILIASTGGNDLTGESVSATAIQNNLETTNVHLQATNNITVNQNITWSTDKQLKLEANNINVNATINNTNSTNGGVYFQAANTTDKVVFGTNGKVIVNNVYQLQWMNTALNGKYELGSDINAGVTRTDTVNWGTTGFNPLGDWSNSFKGIFDGLGHTISDLYINRNSTKYVGLFGYINNSSTVKNIGLTNVDITGNLYEGYVGGLAGENNGLIQNSYSSGSVNGNEQVGGLVGRNWGGGRVQNSYASGSVTGFNEVGGLVGRSEGSTIENSYATGNVSGHSDIHSHVGGLVGFNDGTIENSYASGTVNGDNWVGGLVGKKYGLIENSFYDKETNTAFMNDSSYGETKAEIVNLLTGSEWTTDSSKGRGYGTGGNTDLPFLKNVTKLSNTLFEDGFGTIANPYKITNWTQLQNINNPNILTQNDYYFNLLNNINSSTTGYMGNSGEGWNPIGNNASNKFNGTFDGLGNTISDLYIKRPTQSYVGLFGYINSGSTIKNIGLKDLDITGNYHVGGLIGNNYGTISNSYASGTVSGTSSYIGGLVGDNYAGAISNSYATGTVSGDRYVGGLVGSNAGKISNSYSTGTISGNNNVGGLSGYNVLTILNSFYDKEANSLVSMSDSSLGKTKAEILSAFSGKSGWGTTGAGDSVEGYETVLLPYLIGVTKDEDKSKSILFSGGFGTEVSPYTITNWTQLQNINNSNILTKNYYFNLLNNLSSSTSDYTNFASNTANGGSGWNPIGDNTNRFTGTFDGKDFTISNLYINRPTQNHVGLFGFTNNATIKNIGVVDFEIYALGYSGGLAGSADNNTQISNSYSTGGIYAYTDFGGLIGHLINSSSIEYSYSLANINKRELSSGLLRAGGLVGTVQTSSSVKNSYSIGNITGGNSNDNEVGGLIGYLHGSEVLNSYSSRNINASGTTLIGGLIGKNNDSTASNSFYDKTEYTGNGVGNDQTGVTGKTTQEMSYGETFKNASWGIVADSSINQATPVIKYDSVNNKYFWAISPIALTYTLSDKTTTYDGTTQTLSSFYTSNPFTIPTGYNFLNLTSTDYKFQKDGSDVTGYKDAGTYSNIKVALNGTSATDEFLTISSSGNTDGKLTINKKDLTISAITANNKTYDGTTTATLSNIGTLVGLVTGEDLVLNNPTSVIFSSKDVADGITVTASGYTIADKDSFKASNYNLTHTSKTTTANIVASVNPNPTPTPTPNPTPNP
ncbi:beta strand repeat-containing protein, partial [Aliarcobacter cryaerophilus]|uniref:beta strand repeat-containing protein n=1 Tax=Aliarcobacter cryaerophilus TaxID=28198 RepID=UPI00197CEA87